MTTLRDPAETEKEVRDLGWWYQHFELPGGVWTGRGQEPAYRPETRWRLFEPYLPKDLSGKTVLDVGGNAGYFSIQMMLRGATRCVLVEPYLEFARQAEYAARCFGVELEIVNDDVHVYCLTNADRFDFVLFLGLFYHLKYPVLVLDRLAEMTQETMVFQSHSVGSGKEARADRSNYAPARDDGLLDDPGFPRLSFIEKLYNRDPTTWWIPNPSALEPLLRSAGLKVVARPDPQVLVAQPDIYFGKATYGNLVFPHFGKRGGAVHPGPQRVDPALWEELVRRAWPESPGDRRLSWRESQEDK
jgi:tRNA (mo5U34)-methyltransferase